MEKWPGRLVTRLDLMKASGDSRDWFRYGHWLQLHTQITHEFIDARRRRRDFTKSFDWNQILVLGDYGAGKTTAAIHLARKFFRHGHPVFSNASCLFGWHLEREEMYTALLFAPKNSIILIDESSAHLSSRVGHGVAISSFAESNLNTRKKNCIMVGPHQPSLRRDRGGGGRVDHKRPDLRPDHDRPRWPHGPRPPSRRA